VLLKFFRVEGLHFDRFTDLVPVQPSVTEDVLTARLNYGKRAGIQSEIGVLVHV
jgi:hypothetical protein